MSYISGDGIVDQYWPYDGPHDDDQTRQGAVAIARLVRYLNNATGPGHRDSALPYAATANSVVAGLAGMAGLMPQLLEQLAGFLQAQANDPTLYDDRRDERHYPASRTAQDAVDRLWDAREVVLMLAERLRQVGRYTVHLGNEDPR